MEHQALKRRWAAVIAAGGEAPPDLQAITGENTKAFVSFSGEPSVVRVARAAVEAGCEPVVVAGSKRFPLEGVTFALPGETNITTSANAIAAAGDVDNILFLPSDLPWLKSEHITHFLLAIERRLEDSGSIWFAAGLCSEGEIRKLYPEAKFTYLKLREGRYASGGLYAASRQGFEKARTILERASADRKSAVKLVFQFGLGNAMQYLTGRMSFSCAEASGERVLGGKCVIVPDCHPDSTLDFDDVDDYRYLQSIMK